VVLTVTDNDGDTSQSSTQAIIGDGINLPPTADAGGSYPGAVDTAVQFNGANSDDIDGELVAAEWDFGDDTIGAGLSPTHVYAAPGLYVAKLIVTDDEDATGESEAPVVIGDGLLPPTADADGPYFGIADAPVTFDGTESSDLDGDIASWDWHFGDDTTNTGPTPDNTYVAGGLYNVTVQVTDEDGLMDSDSSTALIGEFSLPPTAVANGPYRGTVLAPVSFDGAASGDPDGSIMSWDWDFGDDTTGTGETTSHTYAADGTYIVKLTVTDDSDETDTDVTNATVGIGNQPPTVETNGTYTGKVDALVGFDGTGSDDPDGFIVSYEWNFGDGNTGAGQTANHFYGFPGIYVVTLTVTDNESARSSADTLAIIDIAGITNPIDELKELIKQVEGLDLHKGTKNSLLANLKNALTSLEREKRDSDKVAINMLRAFINKVNAQSGKKVPKGDADELKEEAERIINAIENSSKNRAGRSTLLNCPASRSQTLRPHGRISPACHQQGRQR